MADESLGAAIIWNFPAGAEAFPGAKLSRPALWLACAPALRTSWARKLFGAGGAVIAIGAGLTGSKHQTRKGRLDRT